MFLRSALRILYVNRIFSLCEGEQVHGMVSQAFGEQKLRTMLQVTPIIGTRPSAIFVKRAGEREFVNMVEEVRNM